ncbi:hypothetical protein I6I07_19285 [Achromobacter deleyi]|uniref:Uncharacterized protein n=1 Tax=Achromobacter deleyi TaxID=1353891 RepID=A0A7T4AZ89_9BURK|nr:hypothetical protein [Achromobacter deleyi]QQB32791.1 hypothetical protein I6I07_19285 [Achromobacter deleyi]
MSRATMPIMGAILLSEIPFAMIQPHEAQALRNHGQTLERLAQRGGLPASEAVAIMKGLRWRAVKTGVPTEHYLINMVRDWRAAQPRQGDT